MGNADHAVITGRLERGVVAHGLDLVFGLGLDGWRVGLGQVARMGAPPADAAVGQDRGQVADLLFGVSTRRQLVVPQHFHTALGNRERNLTEPFDAHAIIDQFGMQGVVLGAIADIIRVAEIAVARVNIHLVRAGVLFQQRFLAVGQVRFVLRHVLRRDHQDRLFCSVRVHWLVTREFHMVPAWHFAQVLTGVRRDSTGGVSGFFGTDAGQLLAQLVGFLGRHLRRCATDQSGIGHHGGREHDTCCCYFHVLPPSLIRLSGVTPSSRSSGVFIVRKD
ncbi:hypothetical protein D3C72_1244940 [compost metagenome]